MSKTSSWGARSARETGALLKNFFAGISDIISVSVGLPEIAKPKLQSFLDRAKKAEKDYTDGFLDVEFCFMVKEARKEVVLLIESHVPTLSAERESAVLLLCRHINQLADPRVLLFESNFLSLVIAQRACFPLSSDGQPAIGISALRKYVDLLTVLMKCENIVYTDALVFSAAFAGNPVVRDALVHLEAALRFVEFSATHSGNAEICRLASDVLHEQSEAVEKLKKSISHEVDLSLVSSHMDTLIVQVKDMEEARASDSGDDGTTARTVKYAPGTLRMILKGVLLAVLRTPRITLASECLNSADFAETEREFQGGSMDAKELASLALFDSQYVNDIAMLRELLATDLCQNIDRELLPVAKCALDVAASILSKVDVSAHGVLSSYVDSRMGAYVKHLLLIVLDALVTSALPLSDDLQDALIRYAEGPGGASSETGRATLVESIKAIQRDNEVLHSRTTTGKSIDAILESLPLLSRIFDTEILDNLRSRLCLNLFGLSLDRLDDKAHESAMSDFENRSLADVYLRNLGQIVAWPVDVGRYLPDCLLERALRLSRKLQSAREVEKHRRCFVFYVSYLPQIRRGLLQFLQVRFGGLPLRALKDAAEGRVDPDSWWTKYFAPFERDVADETGSLDDDSDITSGVEVSEVSIVTEENAWNREGRTLPVPLWVGGKGTKERLVVISEGSELCGFCCL